MFNSKWLKALLIVAAAIFVVHQAYVSFFGTLTTSVATHYTHAVGIDANALMVRDETPVANPEGGVMHYALSDGEKVAKGGVIAQIYDSTETSLAISQIKKLQNRLSDIEEIQSYNDISAVDLELCNHKVNTALYEFLNECSTGRFDNTDTYADNLLTALNRRQYATGETSGFESAALELKAQIEALKATVTEPKQNITSDKSGYFVSSVDGYESVLNTSVINGITPEFIDSVCPDNTNSSSYIGKIVSNYKWYIAANIPLEQAQKLKKGGSATITINLPDTQQITALIYSVSSADSNKNCAVVFECYNTNSALATVRSCPITIITEEYEGLKISNKALRVVDGQTGVYVVTGLQIKFVTTKVLYQTEYFALCEIQNDNPSGLRLYDEVVERGRNLYDGKIIE